MSLEARLEALELRLQAAEDQLEIIRLLNSYGPLVDSGESQAAASLWVGIQERYNRVLDGSADSHDTLGRVLR